MKYKEMKVGMKVRDSWYFYELYGKIISLTRNRCYLLQKERLIKYDRSHFQFLEEDK